MVKDLINTMPTRVPTEEEVMEVDITSEPTVNGSSEQPRIIKLSFKNTNGGNINVDKVYSNFKEIVVHDYQVDAKSPVLVQSIDSSINSALSIVHQAEETSMKLLRFVSSNNFLFRTPVNNLRTHPYLKTVKNPVGNDVAHPRFPVNNYLKKELTDGLEILNTVTAAPKINLPPAGELVRSNLEVGAKVWAMKSSFLGVWLKGIITYIRESPPEKLFKVRYDNHKSNANKFYSAKQMAYENTAQVIIPVGTRIIARYTDTAGRSAHYAGITAEPPKVTNCKRYLIFFDDGCAQYVKHEDLHVVCVQSNDVADDVHDNIMEFVRAYLLQYPERPMVKLQKDQFVKTEYNCEWSEAKVLQVDCSMVQMLFLSSLRTEWIYRGSTRLKPLRNELANAEAHRLEGKNRRRHTTAPRRPHQPYVEYTREEDVVVLDSDSDNENKPSSSIDTKKRKNTARKSLTARPLTSLNVRANPVFRVPDKKSHLGYKEMSLIKSFVRIPFHNHDCAMHCRERDDPVRHKGKNPLLIPIFLGWERQLRRFRACGPGPKVIITYRSPCGRHLRNLEDLQNYLNLIRSRLTVDLFSFNTNVNLFRTFRPKDVLYQNLDITQGKENVPVSCVNSLCNEPPPFVEYSAERFPGEGVFLNLDEEFLCGCSCTDNCENPATCECQRLTSDGKYASQFGISGYDYRRLSDPLTSGIYECNSKCKCNSQCGNRVIQHGLTVRLQMFKTQFKGWGIRCLDDIDAGQFICVYAGQLLTEQGADADGKECGDEYLAELDYIEVIEKNKEGYESDVPEFSMDMDVDHPKETAAFSEDDNSNSSDSDVVFADSDLEFESSSLRSTATSTYATRSRRKNGKRNQSNLLTSEDSSSSRESDKKDFKGLPDISFNLESCRISPRELSPDSAQALEKIELKMKPKISGKGASPRIVAKKSGNMKNPINNHADQLETRFRSVRSYYGEDSLYIMDAKTKGNIGRYLNHSCEPNVFVQNVFVDTHDLRFPAVAFFAQHSIDAGTELTWDYNYEVGSVTDKVMYCYCEAPSCRGRLL